MGRRGPPSKPTALVVLEGDPGKRLRTRKHEPKPPRLAEIPAPPRRLDTIGRAEWRRQTAYLDALGMLHETDLALLEQFCATRAELARLMAARTREQRTKGYSEDLARLDGRLDSKRTVLRQLAREFGFSPASRVGLEGEGRFPGATTGSTKPDSAKARGASSARFFTDRH